MPKDSRLNSKEHLFSVTKKDLRVEMLRGSGKGGQNRNKRDTCVRITHVESGVVGYACDERSQAQNKKLAFRRLINDKKFKFWLNKKTLEAMHQKDIEREVERQMQTHNPKVEGKSKRK